MGRFTNLLRKAKLQDRSQVARYIYTGNAKIIKMQLKNGRITKVRMGDFHPTIHSRDPNKTHRHSFDIIYQGITVVTTSLRMGTPPPVNLKHPMRYPNAAKWKVTREQAIWKIDMERMVEWNQTDLKGERPLPRNITSAEKGHTNGTVQVIKARLSVRAT